MLMENMLFKAVSDEVYTTSVRDLKYHNKENKMLRTLDLQKLLLYSSQCLFSVAGKAQKCISLTLLQTMS